VNATATAVTTAQTAVTVDLDTRLALSLAGMNVLLGRHLTDVEPVEITAPARPVEGNRILTRAAEQIIRRGWHQGGYEGMGGQVCALAAIDRVAVNGPDRSAATRLLMDRIEQIHGRRYGSIHAWNDDRETTEQDVLGLLY